MAASLLPADRTHVLQDWPVFGALLHKRYERMFAENLEANLFRGVFETFDAAQASAPPTRPLGYDHPGPAGMYMDRIRRIYPSDYPILFWLDRLLHSGCSRIFDVGGHIGVGYYAYRRYLTYPASLRWTVYDVPAVVRQGRELAQKMDPDGRLAFSDAFEGGDGADVLLASGSLQYLPDTLADRLKQLRATPRHLLVNLLPVHERESYYTLQSIGTAFCPYRIFSAAAALTAYDSLGYSLVDTWENAEKRCDIPFHPGHSLDRYRGFYFRRD